jgi:hypothetical protein
VVPGKPVVCPLYGERSFAPPRFDGRREGRGGAAVPGPAVQAGSGVAGGTPWTGPINQFILSRYRFVIAAVNPSAVTTAPPNTADQLPGRRRRQVTDN